VQFVRQFAEAKKPIAAICRGPWTLIDADAIRGKKLTSWPSLRTDLKNAGADWVDQMVVVDRDLVTSRKPDDLPAFCEKTAGAVRQGAATRRVTGTGAPARSLAKTPSGDKRHGYVTTVPARR
jgi:protease I